MTFLIQDHRDHAGNRETGPHTKFRRYADLTTRQTKTYQCDFLKTIHEKKCMKCPRTFSLLRAKVLSLANKQSTILCVLRQQIIILECEF